MPKCYTVVAFLAKHRYSTHDRSELERVLPAITVGGQGSIRSSALARTVVYGFSSG